MKKMSYLSFPALIILALIASVAAKADLLPQAPFPIGSPELLETRTIKELRPGLTHVHIERGDTSPITLSKFALIHRTRDPNENAKVREGFEGLGLKVREEVTQRDDKPYYILSAGEFDSQKAAMRVVYKVPVGVHVGHLGEYPPGYVIDIVILDPKKYRGKIVSAWSGSNWRASPLELALKHNAVVATNGSWFEYSQDDVSGVPSGISIEQGLWRHEHQYHGHKHEGMLFIENDPENGPKLSIGYEPPPFPQLKWGNGKSVTLDGIDRMPRLHQNELVAMREEIFWHSQFSHVHPEELLSMRMLGEESSGINLMVLATGNKRAILDEIKSSWDGATLDLSVKGQPGLNAFYTANIFIENGQRPPVSYANGPTARTSIGADAEGKIYLIFNPAGASEYKSSGASLAELQRIGEFLGLINYANMDGGTRSSSMVIEGRVLGDPHFQIYDDERRVADSILIIDDD